MTSKRILVVDDSAFMRAIISDLIVQDPSFTIVGTARNGIEAIVQAKLLQPDAVTLDVEMPVCNGLDALKTIMKECPRPVIMLSSLSEEGGRETIEALENGAFDFVCKPSPTNGTQDINKVGDMLIERLHAALKTTSQYKPSAEHELGDLPQSGLATITGLKDKTPSKYSQGVRVPSEMAASSMIGNRNKFDKPTEQKNKRESETERASKSMKKVRPSKPAAVTESSIEKLKREMSTLRAQDSQSSLRRTTASKQTSDLKKQPAAVDKIELSPNQDHTKMSYKHLLAIGTSTGGPRALKEVLSKLPGSLEAPVLIVQHMPPNFTKSLAERLHTYSELEVKEAEQGDELLAGTAYLAPGGQHMTVIQRADGKLVIDLSRGQPRSGHRPSVDALFESLHNLTQYHRHLVLLTGMGSDGARAMKALCDHGVTSTFAESEQTCIVYGMPRAAVEMGCVKHIVDLQDMAKEIVKAME